ncbi:ATP-binding protein [bacterium]|nr:ATP-binding protein [bacterium]
MERDEPGEESRDSMRVAETPASTALEYTVEMTLPDELPLDEVVCCAREVEGHGRVRFYGVVDSAEMSTVYSARVKIIRIFPEVFVPPEPGTRVWRSNAENVAWALHFAGMKRKFAAGMLANGQPAYFNLDFLCGEKGAHLNIAGISGVATKTSYALFLLYSMFHCPEAADSRAILFNVKGDDLLYLDKPNASLGEQSRLIYEELGLPCGPFPEVAYHGNQGGMWNLRQFAERELVRFLFSDEDPSGSQEFAIDNLAWVLKSEAAKTLGPELVVLGETVTSLAQLSGMICDSAKEAVWFEKASYNTRMAIVRRLRGITPQVEALLGPGQSFDYESQLNVVDLHLLTEKARAFVVGSVLKSLFEGREKLGDKHPTVFLVLDELNKYAPREGGGRIRQMLLDVAERGRSLGIVLVGAEQTASAVEERVVGNAALRVVGRLESGESLKDAYGWLSAGLRRRATLLQPGTMVVSQPQVPVPLVVRFPFPAWATRRSEVESA